MHLLRWLIAALAALESGWMVFDGLRALIVGDYVTPAGGPYAGQLGPWAGLVSALGIDPRGTPMKSFFVLYGVGWLGVTVAFLRGARRSWAAMTAAAAASLWYLVVGTVLSVVQLALLLFVRARSAAAVRRFRSAGTPAAERP